ncbi:hypothetical protein [Nioella nitratireducens]|uniref:hypothetical protein n=1 Tax=Nioella nitratireducens TaxID=1287720 RepID=UPI0011BA7821|nr:hypothetical protein [Nioella nitratireducens]
MARGPRNVITVSPPNLERTGFLSLEQGFAGPSRATRRDWLLERFSEGLQVRMLRPPLRGFVEFAPCRVSWQPLACNGDSVVIERLEIDPGSRPSPGLGTLLRAAEEWAGYFGFASVLLPIRAEAGVSARALSDHGYCCVDRTVGKTGLWMRVLHGPTLLPFLPQDWQARTAALGPGLVVQSGGQSDEQHDIAQGLLDRATAAGLPARFDLLTCAEDARKRTVWPGTLFSVVLDGEVIDTGQGSLLQIWQEVRRRKRL